MGVTGQCDFGQRHIGGQFILQTIGVDENAVVFFFEALHFQSHCLPVSADFFIGGFQGWLVVVGVQKRDAREVP